MGYEINLGYEDFKYDSPDPLALNDPNLTACTVSVPYTGSHSHFREKIDLWCALTVTGGYAWLAGLDGYISYTFDNANDAILFKLAWG